jgi:hypothetical protein
VFSPSTINDCTLVGIVNGGRLNLGNVQQNGLDLTASYTRDTDLGTFGGSVTASKILNLKKRPSTGRPRRTSGRAAASITDSTRPRWGSWARP